MKTWPVKKDFQSVIQLWQIFERIHWYFQICLWILWGFLKVSAKNSTFAWNSSLLQSPDFHLRERWRFYSCMCSFSMYQPRLSVHSSIWKIYIYTYKKKNLKIYFSPSRSLQSRQEIISFLLKNKWNHDDNNLNLEIPENRIELCFLIIYKNHTFHIYYSI